MGAPEGADDTRYYLPFAMAKVPKAPASGCGEELSELEPARHPQSESALGKAAVHFRKSIVQPRQFHTPGGRSCADRTSPVHFDSSANDHHHGAEHHRRISRHAAGIPPVIREISGHEAKASSLDGDAQPEIPVLARAQPEIETTSGFDGTATDDQRMRRPRVEFKQPVEDILRLWDARMRVDWLALVVNDRASGIGRDGPGVGGQDRCHIRVHRRRDKVVRVEKLQKFSGGMSDPHITSGTQALIGLLDVFDAVAIGRRDRGGFIGGAIVHDDDLDPGIDLSQRAIDGLGEKLRLVEAGNDHADGRIIPKGHG